MKSCMFVGQYEISHERIPKVEEQLYSLIETALADGFERFVLEGASGFTALAGKILLDIRENRPLLVEVLIPYWPRPESFSEDKKEEYISILERADWTEQLSLTAVTDGVMRNSHLHYLYNHERCIAWRGSSVESAYARLVGREWIILNED